MESVTVDCINPIDLLTPDVPHTSSSNFTLPTFCEPLPYFLFEPGSGESLAQAIGIETPVTSRPMPEMVYRPTTNPGLPSLTKWKPVYGIVEALRGLARIEKLEPNWDSYGSEPPSAVAIATARDLVWTVLQQMFVLFGERAIPYSIAPLSGGGVQIEWRGSTGAIEVEIGPEGKFGYLVARGKEPPQEFEEGDDIPKLSALGLIRSIIQ